MKQEWIVTDLETGKVLKKWIVNPAKGGKKSGVTKRAKKKKKLLAISLSLFAIGLYGSLASAGVPVLTNSDFSIPAWNYVVATRQPEVGKRAEVKTQVLAMLAEEGIDTVKADRIIFCESSWNPRAVNHNRNGSNDMGLWQLNSIHQIPDEVRLDPIKSTEEAIKLIKKKGFQPWVCQ